MPTVTFQSGFNSFGQTDGAATPTASPSRFGPRHCGHSAVAAAGALPFPAAPTAGTFALSATAGVGVVDAGAVGCSVGAGVAAAAASPTSEAGWSAAPQAASAKARSA